MAGDRRKSALLSCHDVGLDPQSCFQVRGSSHHGHGAAWLGDVADGWTRVVSTRATGYHTCRASSTYLLTCRLRATVQGLLMCAGAESALVKNFCHYHLVLPGFEVPLPLPSRCLHVCLVWHPTVHSWCEAGCGGSGGSALLVRTMAAKSSPMTLTRGMRRVVQEGALGLASQLLPITVHKCAPPVVS